MLVSGSVVQEMLSCWVMNKFPIFCWSPVTPEVEIGVSADNLLVFQTVFGSNASRRVLDTRQDIDHPLFC